MAAKGGIGPKKMNPIVMSRLPRIIELRPGKP